MYLSLLSSSQTNSFEHVKLQVKSATSYPIYSRNVTIGRTLARKLSVRPSVSLVRKLEKLAAAAFGPGCASRVGEGVSTARGHPGARAAAARSRWPRAESGCEHFPAPPLEPDCAPSAARTALFFRGRVSFQRTARRLGFAASERYRGPRPLPGAARLCFWL